MMEQPSQHLAEILAVHTDDEIIAALTTRYPVETRPLKTGRKVVIRMKNAPKRIEPPTRRMKSPPVNPKWKLDTPIHSRRTAKQNPPKRETP